VVLGNKTREKLGTLTDSAHARTVRATTADGPDRGPSGLRAGPSARSFWVRTGTFDAMKKKSTPISFDFKGFGFLN
jgi:hypothetical protein